MKLTYRDKIILAIFLAAAILIGGFVGLIKPKNEGIKEQKKVLSTKEEERDKVKKTIAQIEPLQEQIEKIVEDSKLVSDKFVDRTKINSTVKLDEFMMPFANDNEIQIMNLAAGDMAESSLGYYYIPVQDVGSGLRKLADFTGEYQKEVDNSQAEQNQLAEREKASVFKTDYAIEAKCQKKNLWKLMDVIQKYDDAIIINSLDYDLSEDPDAEEFKEDYKKPELTKKEIKEDDYVDIKVSISLYSVYDMKKPNFEKAE